MDYTSVSAINSISQISQATANAYIESGVRAAAGVGATWGCTPGALLYGAATRFAQDVNNRKNSVNTQIARVKQNKIAQYRAWVAEQERLRAEREAAAAAEAERLKNAALTAWAAAYMMRHQDTVNAQQQAKAAAPSAKSPFVTDDIFGGVPDYLRHEDPSTKDIWDILDIAGDVLSVGTEFKYQMMEPFLNNLEPDDPAKKYLDFSEKLTKIIPGLDVGIDFIQHLAEGDDLATAIGDTFMESRWDAAVAGISNIPRVGPSISIALDFADIMSGGKIEDAFHDGLDYIGDGIGDGVSYVWDYHASGQYGRDMANNPYAAW